MLNLSTGQYVFWCKTVIHHAATKAIQNKKKHRSRELLLLNRPSTDSESELGDSIADASNTSDFQSAECRLLIDSLPQNQADVMILLYLFGFTQQEAAKHLHTSQQQVSRIHKLALSTLRKQLEEVM